MMGSSKWWMVALAFALAGTTAQAATRAGTRKRVPRARKRDAVQSKRIRSGVRDGSLTPRETRRLAKEQQKIQGMAKHMASDGKVTPREKAALERAQDKASTHIAKERHDAQGTMGPKPPRRWKTWDPGVNQRQRNQHHRIAQGIRSGSLTPAETRGLIHTESEIRKMERSMKRDGVLTKEERHGLHAALSEASKAIYDAKHNDATRPSVRAALKAKIDAGQLSDADAAELFAQCRRVCEIRRTLGGPMLPADARAALENEYADLAAQLFD